MPIEAAAGPVVVLHVEDDKAVSTSVHALLQTAGYRVSSVGDGEEAVRLVSQEKLRPDVLIVDFRLPGGMNGTDVAEEIQELLGYPVPTIILSGELANAEVPWLPGAPLLPLSKPVSPEILLKSVAVFAELQRFVRSEHCRCEFQRQQRG
jgi:two-component system CheB/CheR fusion protein